MPKQVFLSFLDDERVTISESAFDTRLLGQQINISLLNEIWCSNRPQKALQGFLN